MIQPGYDGNVDYDTLVRLIGQKRADQATAMRGNRPPSVSTIIEGGTKIVVQPLADGTFNLRRTKAMDEEALLMAMLDSDDEDEIRAIAEMAEKSKRRKDATLKTLTTTAQFLKFDPETNSADFVISTEDVDRDGDTLDMDGIDLSEYRANPIVCLNHDTDDIPIGVSEDPRTGELMIRKMEVNGKPRLVSRVYFNMADDRAKRVADAVKGGFMRAASVSFDPVPNGTEKNGHGGSHYRRWKLIEWSVVTVPANAQAVRHVRMLCKSLGLKTIKKAFTQQQVVDFLMKRDFDGLERAVKNELDSRGVLEGQTDNWVRTTLMPAARRLMSHPTGTEEFLQDNAERWAPFVIIGMDSLSRKKSKTKSVTEAELWKKPPYEVHQLEDGRWSFRSKYTLYGPFATSEQAERAAAKVREQEKSISKSAAFAKGVDGTWKALGPDDREKLLTKVGESVEHVLEEWWEMPGSVRSKLQPLVEEVYGKRLKGINKGTVSKYREIYTLNIGKAKVTFVESDDGRVSWMAFVNGYEMAANSGFSSLDSAKRDAIQVVTDKLNKRRKFIKTGSAGKERWMKSLSKSAAFDEGFDARNRGAGRESCPYSDDPQKAEWLQGWESGTVSKVQGDWIKFSDVPMGQTFSFGGELWLKIGDGMAEGVPSKNRRAFNPGQDVKEDESQKRRKFIKTGSAGKERWMKVPKLWRSKRDRRKALILKADLPGDEIDEEMADYLEEQGLTSVETAEAPPAPGGEWVEESKAAKAWRVGNKVSIRGEDNGTIVADNGNGFFDVKYDETGVVTTEHGDDLDVPIKSKADDSQLDEALKSFDHKMDEDQLDKLMDEVGVPEEKRYAFAKKLKNHAGKSGFKAVDKILKAIQDELNGDGLEKGGVEQRDVVEAFEKCIKFLNAAKAKAYPEVEEVVEAVEEKRRKSKAVSDTDLMRFWQVAGDEVFDLIHNGSDRIAVDLGTGKPKPFQAQDRNVQAEFAEGYKDVHGKTKSEDEAIDTAMEELEVPEAKRWTVKRMALAKMFSKRVKAMSDAYVIQRPPGGDGKFFVMVGDKQVEGPFDTEEEAEQAAAFHSVAGTKSKRLSKADEDAVDDVIETLDSMSQGQDTPKHLKGSLKACSDKLSGLKRKNEAPPPPVAPEEVEMMKSALATIKEGRAELNKNFYETTGHRLN